jgi:hypothetical protein
MSIKLTIAAVILLQIVSSGAAQNNEIKFTPINGINGNSIGKIRNITQDPHGYTPSGALGLFFFYVQITLCKRYLLDAT